MKIRFWGVRGSIPTPGKDTVVFGGNTSCVSVEFGDNVIIFDAGTGIRLCGNYLMSLGGKVEAAVMISHTHWDHIQGFPFFVPSYIPGNKFMIYGPPSEVKKRSLRQIMEIQASHEYFPVSTNQLAADIAHVDCRERKIITGDFEIETCRLNHPVMSLAYKLTHDGVCMVYGGDHEPFRNLYRDADGSDDMDEEVLQTLDNDAAEQNARIVEFLRGADIVTWDAQYTHEEYQTKKGWGHSWYEADLELAKKAGVKHLVMTHHDPASTDDVLRQREEKYREQGAAMGVRVDFSREGMVVEI